MPEYLAPGVYVEETSFRPKSIEGVSTSTTAFVGPTRKGPLGVKPGTPGLMTPEVITSFGEFERMYGGLSNLSFEAGTDTGPRLLNYMAYAAKAFFDNGGARLFVARTFTARSDSDNGRARSKMLIDGADAKDKAFFEARMPGAGLNCTVRALMKTTKVGRATLKSAPVGSLLRDLPAGPAVLPGKPPPYALTEGDKLTLLISGVEKSIAFTDANVGDLSAVTIPEINTLLTTPANGAHATTAAETGTLAISTTAVGEAARLAVATDPSKTSPAVITALGLPTTEAIGSASGQSAHYYYFNGTAWKAKDGGADLDVDKLTTAYLATMTLLVTDKDGNEILYDDLGLSAHHPRWVGEILKDTPSRKLDAMLNPIYLSIGSNVLSSENPTFKLLDAIFPDNKTEATYEMTGGNDGAAPMAVHPPSADAKMTAAYDDCLQLFEKIEDISILAAPGHSANTESEFKTIQSLLISHCERVKYRIAVLDTPSGLTPGEAMNVRSEIDSTRAALYYPWVIIANPSATPSDDRIPKEIAVPPSGFVSGIYARTDITRGVWKAPANEIVRGALRFETDISFGQQEILNPVGVNCLRFFYGRGYRLWGARTASSDPEWKYVNVRRYFIYLERSIDRSTQWAVFEPNGEALWANIRETVSSFLFNEWRSGALLGTEPQEAFFVRCDRSTMTQNDLDNGRLICLIGVAALKPAEFVIFRIGQKTVEARD